MRPINIEKTVGIKHLSVNSEFRGEEKVLACSLTLEGTFHIKEIVEIFDAEAFDIEVFESLYWDEKGDRLSESDHTFKFDYAVKGLRFEIFKTTFEEKKPKVSVFLSMETKAQSFTGQFTVGHQMSIKFSVYFVVTAEQLGIVASTLNELRQIKLEPVQLDMLED